MAEKNGLKRFNGGAPALIRHVIAILGVLIVASFTVGVFLTNIENSVQATEKKVTENRARVEAIERSINEMVVEQKVLIQRFDDEKEDNKEFRDRTGNALDRILERLPRRQGPVR